MSKLYLREDGCSKSELKTNICISYLMAKKEEKMGGGHWALEVN